MRVPIVWKNVGLPACSVNVPSAGMYQLTARVASASDAS